MYRGMDTVSDATCDVTFVEQEATEVLKKEEPRVDSGDTARRNMWFAAFPFGNWLDARSA